MSKAFVDTTIIADVLLKPSSPKGQRAIAGLARFDETELPVYAIKEFKAGALRGYIWLHNAFVTENSYQRTILRIQALATSLQKNLTTTALEALAEASSQFNSMSNEAMVTKYGPKALGDSMQVDSYRLRLKELVYRAWKKRRSVTKSIVVPISCYSEKAPYDDRHGLIKYDPYKCQIETECSLAKALRRKLNDLAKLEVAATSTNPNLEQKRRRKVLHDIYRTPKRPVTDKMCRTLGDAFFAIFCPEDATILTTNLKDHEPLAQALGKTAERP